MADFFQQYFVDVIWERTGYNIYNTAAYAVIALLASYLLYRIFEHYKIKIDRQFVYAIIPFVLLGSTMRVLTDAVDTGVVRYFAKDAAFGPIYSALLNTHIFDYGYLTVTPGIYLVTAALLLATMLICYSLKKPKFIPVVGIALWLPNFLLLLPLILLSKFAPMSFIYGAFVLVLALTPAYLAYLALKSMKLDGFGAVVVFAHALDGAATFVVIDLFGKFAGIAYGEQHVVPNIIGGVLGETGYGFFLFYLVKVVVAFLAAYFINRETSNERERYFLFLLLIIMGLAPGIRDLLRMLAGA